MVFQDEGLGGGVQNLSSPLMPIKPVDLVVKQRINSEV